MAAGLPILVSAHWLDKHSNDANLFLLDATIPVPGADPNNVATKKIIPKALRFDIDTEFSDQTAPYPHTCLSDAIFTAKVQALGINANSTIVVYDDIGIFSSPRAWWMFKAMGHEKIFILDGGLPAWQQAGLPTDGYYGASPSPGNFQAKLQPRWFVNIIDVEKTLSENNVTVIDARNADRFNSRIDEPRPGLRRGNIPGSLNMPFAQVLQDGYYKPVAALEREFKNLKLNKQQSLYFSCGSGVTACIDAVAALLCGYQNVSVYDGSWCEWGTTYPNN